jgi:ribosomal-protein-alanine N-acetyltransferase
LPDPQWELPLADSLIRHSLTKILSKMTTTETIIKTNRLLLRQFVDSDIENVFRGLSHPDIIRYYGISFDSLEATKEQMIWFANLEKEGTGIWFAVCSLDNKTFYGAGGLNSLSKEHKKAEIGFWLLPNFWGKGIMKEAMPLICDFGFDKLGLNRIEGFVESENTNCKNAMAKLDFQHEGTMKNCEIKNGKFISLDIYAKVK